VTEVVFTVTEVLTKTTKKREIFLYSKASEAEICTRVRRRYLLVSNFENYPGLTELYAAED